MQYIEVTNLDFYQLNHKDQHIWQMEAIGVDLKLSELRDSLADSSKWMIGWAWHTEKISIAITNSSAENITIAT